MSEFLKIQSSVSEELTWLNQTMRSALSSNSPLLQHIVEMFLQRKGKQIRPLLVILTAKIFSEANEKTINAAASIELLHNASLVHDDVLDETQIRRGRNTINSRWDNQVAVLVGDFFVSRALHCAVNTGDIRVVRTLSTLGTDLSSGEIDQMNNARTHYIEESRYLNVIKHKTASLFKGCVEVGGYTAGATEAQISPLLQYAELLGCCFQIKDDIFDYFDSDKEVGKPSGNDLREGKVTLPLIYALTQDESQESASMRKIIDKDELSSEDITTLIEFAKRKGGIEYAYKRMDEIKTQANDIIDQLPQSEALLALRHMLDFIISRNN